MDAGDVVSATFHRLLYGRKFTSFDALEDAISRFTEETGHRFKPVNSHRLPAGSPNAEKFVFYSRKYVCVLASTRHRTGCDAFFNIQYRREGCLAVTSSHAIHGHEPAPGAPRSSKQRSPGSRLTDFRALRPTSPTAMDQTRRLCAVFKDIFKSGVYETYEGLMSAIREYEKASFTNFIKRRSERLPSGHPLVDTLKFRYIYFICCHSGVFRSCGSRTKSTSLKFGCTARFTAMVTEGKLRVKALNLRHNHLCSKEMSRCCAGRAYLHIMKASLAAYSVIEVSSVNCRGVVQVEPTCT
nr:unnamed protein product [Spirometra erinaceieuropaei]